MRSTQRQPRWALTRPAMVALMWLASSAKAPSMRSTSVAGALGPSGSRLSPRGGHCNCSGWANLGDRLADDLLPMGDEARLAHAAHGERRSHDVAEAGAERSLAGRAGFAHSAGQVKTGLMADSLDRARAALKRRGVAVDVLNWWDRHRRELPWRARPGERPDPYRVWLSEVLLQQTTATGAALTSSNSCVAGQRSRRSLRRRSKR